MSARLAAGRCRPLAARALHVGRRSPSRRCRFVAPPVPHARGEHSTCGSIIRASFHTYRRRNQFYAGPNARFTPSRGWHLPRGLRKSRAPYMLLETEACNSAPSCRRDFPMIPARSRLAFRSSKFLSFKHRKVCSAFIRCISSPRRCGNSGSSSRMDSRLRTPHRSCAPATCCRHPADESEAMRN